MKRDFIIVVTLMFLVTLFISCKQQNREIFSNTFEIRQLIKEDKVEDKSSGSYFLIADSYSNSTSRETVVKMFVKADGMYRLIEIPLEDVRVNIDDSLSHPNLEVKYKKYESLKDNEVLDLLRGCNSCYCIKIIINCPEKYLPERLLPVEL